MAYKSTRGFRDLLVWQRMQEFVVLVYELTGKLPESEKFGLVSQMRRAAVSVLSNFVEGYLKSSKKEKRLYLERAETSLLEVDAQCEVCIVLGYVKKLDGERFENKKGEVSFLLYRYKSKIV